MSAVEPNIMMWLTFLIIGGAVLSYALEKWAIEITSLATISALLLLFQFGPTDVLATPPSLKTLLAGFADPALIAILALMVIGRGMVETAALDGLAKRFMIEGRKRPVLTFLIILIVVMGLSGFMNNTPVVVIFIPILLTLSQNLKKSASHVMIPLSFAAILGGNLTLIGSSTNLLVSSQLEASTGHGLNFFEITVQGLALATIGLIFLSIYAPRILKDRAGMKSALMNEQEGRQFVLQAVVRRGSKLEGLKSFAGMFPDMKDVTLYLLQRGEDAISPPFDDVTLKAGDELIIAATRQSLNEFLKSFPDALAGFSTSPGVIPSGDAEYLVSGRQMMVEAMVAPASDLIGRTLETTHFHANTGLVVLGVHRRSRMIRGSISRLRLAAGDVLLLMGPRTNVRALRSNRDVLLLEWSMKALPLHGHAPRAQAIFLGVVALAATGIMPITLSALLGAGAMVAGGCLHLRSAFRAIDTRIVFLIATALAMGTAMQATGGAYVMADTMLGLLEDAPPSVILSAYFLLVAVVTNILSNNATAVLFTPVGLSLAQSTGIDPAPFVAATIFAANSSFATPMGYQTNLLVMGPGHYRFADYLRIGVPMVILMWLGFTLLAPWYYGLA